MEQQGPARKKQKAVALCAIGLSVLASVVIMLAVGKPMIKYLSDPEGFRAWVGSHGFWGRLAYVGMVFFQVVVAIIPGEPFEIAGGYAFGAVEGTLLCLLASTLGSVTVFFLVRKFGYPLASALFSGEKLDSVRFLKQTKRRDFIFLVVFMLPGTPKDLLCWFAGLTDIRFPVWLLICSLGRVPAVVTSTVGGDVLGSKNYWGAVIVFAATLLISGLGLLLYERIRRKNEK